MNYKQVLFKDKVDLKGVYQEYFPGATLLGTYESCPGNPDFKLLSVKNSKVGAQSLKKFPGLEWVVCRSHGVDNVNFEVMRKHNVGVCATAPTTESVTRWVLDKTKDTESPYAIIGSGKIGKRIHELLDGSILVDTRKPKDVLKLKDVNTIVLASSPTGLPSLNKSDLKDFNGSLISISRDECIDSPALIEAIKDGRLKTVHIDILNKKTKEVIKDVDGVNLYQHEAWNYEFEYDERYFKELKHVIDGCLNDIPVNVYRKRSSGVKLF